MCGALIAASLLTGGTTMMAPTAVYASSTVENLIYGAAALLFVSNYYTKMDDGAQAQLLSECQQQTGVSEDPAADNRVQNVYQTLVDSGDIQRDYAVYVSPDTSINAFMSLGGVMCVNQGTLDSMDDDEMAYVMAHELAHGEKRHSVNGVKKKVGLATAVSIYLSDDPTIGSVLLAEIGANYISNAVFTKDQEKVADDLGFDYLVDAGYNPGAAAASMSVLNDKYGDNTPTGLKAVIAPGNHPKTTDRINKNVKRMYEYSNKHVNVEDGWIVVNGDKTFQPVASGQYTAAERTYLSAGKLARLYHDKNVGPVTYENSSILCGGTPLYTVSSTEDGNAIAASLNTAVMKDTGADDEDVWESEAGKEARERAEEQAKEQAEAAAKAAEAQNNSEQQA
jgi:Zn-dependent protease with chaperone function